MGIVGLGAIGAELAAIAAPFGFRVSAIRRRVDRPAPPGVDEVCAPDRLLDLLAQSDVVVIAAPHTPDTKRLIGRREVEAMKRGALLVNVSRGKMIDDQAVVEALTDGRLGGAALDVFTTEPLAPDSPLLGPAERHRHAAHVRFDGGLLDAARRPVLGKLTAVRIGPRSPECGGQTCRILSGVSTRAC